MSIISYVCMYSFSPTDDTNNSLTNSVIQFLVRPSSLPLTALLEVKVVGLWDEIEIADQIVHVGFHLVGKTISVCVLI